MSTTPEQPPKVWSNPNTPHDEHEYIDSRIETAETPELGEWYRKMFDEFGDFFATWLYLDDYLMTSAEINDIFNPDSND